MSNKAIDLALCDSEKSGEKFDNENDYEKSRLKRLR